MVVSDKVRLLPTKEQEELFRSFCGVARFTYNECLAYKIQQYQNFEHSCSVQELIEHIQDLKYSGNYDWLLNVPEAITKQAIKDLDKAYKRFFSQGNKGFPKFKRKGKCKLSFYQRTDGLHFCADIQAVKLTGIKTKVRVSRPLLNVKTLNPRVSFDGKFWYLSYSYEIAELPMVSSGDVIGVDLGIKSLATLSTGKVYENINKSMRVRNLEKKKKRLQRKLSNKYEMNKQGIKFVKTNNIIKLENQIRLIDRKLRNIRDTYIHTVTTDIVRTKPYAIVIEDLNVSGMMKNRHLSRAIQQQCFYKFRQYLSYRCQYFGIRLIVADRFYPSSKTCSSCGYKYDDLKLSDRVFVCPHCHNSLDRDLNASYNLRDFGIKSLA